MPGLAVGPVPEELVLALIPAGNDMAGGDKEPLLILTLVGKKAAGALGRTGRLSTCGETGSNGKVRGSRIPSVVLKKRAGMRSLGPEWAER